MRGIIFSNLALEGKATSQHVRPSLKPGPLVSQKAPSGVGETSGTVLSMWREKSYGLCKYVQMPLYPVYLYLSNESSLTLVMYSCGDRLKLGRSSV